MSDESNSHIRTDTSPEREHHLRVLAQTDNAMRDAMAMLDKAREAVDGLLTEAAWLRAERDRG